MISQKSWQNYLDYRLEERESMYKTWEKPVDQPIEKISSDLMQYRLQLCAAEENLNRRLLMLQKLKTQVERASVPYIDFMIKKTQTKMEM